jgi:hypothetical protein
MEFNAGQVIGKTLVARQPVSLTRLPKNGANSIYVVQPGQTVGIVQSYVAPSASRFNLWWSFVDSNGKPFYAEHEPGLFDVQNLRNQGLLTLEERKEKADEAAKPVSTKIMDLVKKTALLAVAAYLVATFIKSRSYASK